MVKRKDEEPEENWLNNFLDRFDKEHPIVDTRYYVVEVTPGCTIRIANGDGHGGPTYEWESAKDQRVSEYTNDIEKAQRFVDEHDPDPGKTLEIRTEHKRQYVTERWT